MTAVLHHGCAALVLDVKNSMSRLLPRTRPCRPKPRSEREVLAQDLT